MISGVVSRSFEAEMYIERILTGKIEIWESTGEN